MIKRIILCLLVSAALLMGCGQKDVDQIKDAVTDKIQEVTDSVVNEVNDAIAGEKYYDFRKPKHLTEHYKKHGKEMGFKTESAYLDGANAVINNPTALHKLEAEDQDHVYFIESTGEIVFLSQDGYIRTYFISDKDYYDRQ